MLNDAMFQSSTTISLSEDQRSKYAGWLKNAYKAAIQFDGSEKAQEKVLSPLLLADAFIKSVNNGEYSLIVETLIGEQVQSDLEVGAPITSNAILAEAHKFYDRIENTGSDTESLISLIGDGGALIFKSERVFIPSTDGRMQTASLDNPSRYEMKTLPRFPILLKHLSEMGIYTDDLIVYASMVDTNMMRKRPYLLVQIPRMDVEIAVCDQVGEITFVKRGIIGSDLWGHLDKDELKARSDIRAVRFNSEDQWWDGIRSFIEGAELGPKVNLKSFAKKRPLDIGLIKASLLAHRQKTGEWLKAFEKGSNGKKGHYILEHGPYAGQITAAALYSALSQGLRGLPGGSSTAILNTEVSKEHNLDYFNHLDQQDLDIDLIKASLLAHRQATSEWLSVNKKGGNGKKGSYVLEHGPYAGEITCGAIDAALSDGYRGLPNGLSIATLNAEVSEEHNLDYINVHNQNDLDIDLIKESLLAHRQATGEWLSAVTKRENDKKRSYILEHGPYAGKMTVAALASALSNGFRGLPGGSSIPTLNAEVSKEHNLDYFNHIDQEDLDIDLIKASLLAHRQKTGEWLSAGKKGSNGKNGYYILEHGPYAGEMTVTALNTVLSKGARGLPGGSSIPTLNAEVSKEHKLDYINIHHQDNLDIDLIKVSLLAHRQETGEWLSANKKGSNGKKGHYVLEHGPYAGEMTAAALYSALSKGLRGLSGGSSIATLNAEVSKEHSLDYVNRMDQEDLDIDLIKESLLAHKQETGEWLSGSKKGENGKRGHYVLEHGPYAGEMKCGALNSALFAGSRGLSGGSSIATLNAEVSKEHGLDYTNHLKAKSSAKPPSPSSF